MSANATSGTKTAAARGHICVSRNIPTRAPWMIRLRPSFSVRRSACGHTPPDSRGSIDHKGQRVAHRERWLWLLRHRTQLLLPVQIRSRLFQVVHWLQPLLRNYALGCRRVARLDAPLSCAYLDRLESAKASADFGAELAAHDLDRK